MATEALFALREVRFTYPGAAAPAVSLDRLELQSGGIHVVAGGNGSGKTTLLKLLNALLVPQEGQVLFRGRPVCRAAVADREALAALRRESVLVHQDPYLLEGTVYQNLAYALRLRRLGEGETRRRVGRALEEVGLPGFAHRRARRLSGGEKQRVALARALALEAPVLLLDEPTANVDVGSTELLEELIIRVAAQGRTVILSSHNRPFAYRVGTALLSLEQGRPVPSRHNVFKGLVESTDERFTCFRSGSGLLRCPAQQGRFSTAVLALDDVILSREPIQTSAQNQLTGRVLDTRREGALVRVSLDCGLSVPVQAAITEYSRQSLGVVPGGSFYVTFKASAIRLY